MNLTPEEIYWIERTADIESSLALDKFLKLCQTDTTKLNEQEITMLKNYGSELINNYTILKELRFKCEVNRHGEIKK